MKKPSVFLLLLLSFMVALRAAMSLLQSPLGISQSARVELMEPDTVRWKTGAPIDGLSAEMIRLCA